MAVKYEFCLLAAPAKAQNQPEMDEMTAKIPPIICKVALPVKEEPASKKKVMSKVKNKLMNNTMNLSVHNMRKQNIAQPPK